MQKPLVSLCPPRGSAATHKGALSRGWTVWTLRRSSAPALNGEKRAFCPREWCLRGTEAPLRCCHFLPSPPGSQECGLAEEELEGLQRLSVGSGCKYGVWPLKSLPCSLLLSIPLLGSIWATCPVCRGARRHSEGLERVASWFESWLQCSWVTALCTHSCQRSLRWQPMASQEQ